MAVSIATIRTGIATVLDTISGLRVYTWAPDSINEFPCIYIRPDNGIYPMAMRGANAGVEAVFELVLFASRANDAATAQSVLDAYIAPQGSSSIQATIASDRSLNGAADTSWIERFYDYGGLSYGGVDYIGVKFELQVKALTK